MPVVIDYPAALALVRADYHLAPPYLIVQLVTLKQRIEKAARTTDLRLPAWYHTGWSLSLISSTSTSLK